jgi:hypothetical protein
MSRTETAKRLLTYLVDAMVTSESDYPDAERRAAAHEAYRDSLEAVRSSIDGIEAEIKATLWYGESQP